MSTPVTEFTDRHIDSEHLRVQVAALHRLLVAANGTRYTTTEDELYRDVLNCLAALTIHDPEAPIATGGHFMVLREKFTPGLFTLVATAASVSTERMEMEVAMAEVRHRHGMDA